MADYNVNMKQWNGTSFDNVLPLAYNAKQLDGHSLAEVKQLVQDNGLFLYAGQYTGTGTYGSSNPTSITFPFEPILLIGPHTENVKKNTVIIYGEIPTGNYMSALWFEGQNYDAEIKKSANGKTITWFSRDSSSQCNNIGSIYYYAAIGVWGGATEWTITSSGTWTVPRTGRYMLELYGHGGHGASNNILFGYASGGASCQSYNSIELVKGDSIVVSIGTSGSSGTSFGSYSVGNGTDGGQYYDGAYHAGQGAGNKGANGTLDRSNIPGKTYGSGLLSTVYGYGGNGNGGDGGPGAVYLKYLGD